MLQQTRVSAVIPYYLRWLSSFPTVASLANATEEQVNERWAGLGFYRRARYLHEGAKHVVAEHGGVFPTERAALLKIPGVGPYTAGAVASICFGDPTPAVDGNVLRVLSRVTGVCASAKGRYLTHFGQELAGALYEDFPPGVKPGDFNQALMEVGATYCAPRGSGVDPRDPLAAGGFYLSTQLAGDVEEYLAAGGEAEALRALARRCACGVCCEKGGNGVLKFLDGVLAAGCDGAAAHRLLPLEAPKKGKRDEVRRVAVLADPEGKMLLGRRRKGGLLEGQWEFPSFVSDTRLAKDGGGGKDAGEWESTEEGRRDGLDGLLGAILPFADEAGKGGRKVLGGEIVHVFTHVRHFLTVETGAPTGDLTVVPPEGEGGEHEAYEWLSKEELEGRGVTSAIKKILKAIDGGGGKKRKAGEKLSKR
ncbi:hypothetical protein TeGR_g13439 [Tetraparma gracilis]|uniref:Adenine DNA glycosylase n=1 Tax=Tetraparma gracilis TaxID=2962635 RepID=A0ABQ6N845_9STRA|nr:hypothetical protein TeGR_g13439 [Tetraparma gracilis]